MKGLRTILFAAIFCGILCANAIAQDVAKGKALFNDPKLSGGAAGKSCNSCHKEGKGLEGVADKKDFNIMGKPQKSLEDAINACIEMAVKGKPLDKNSHQMKDLSAYIKSLSGKDKAPKKKKVIEGC